jgi:hypothetical protein
VDDIATALHGLLRKGLPVLPDAAPELLLELRGVQARAIDRTDKLSLVKALNQLLVRVLAPYEKAEGVERALPILFALSPEDRGVTLTTRRDRARSLVGYDQSHFRTVVEKRLVREVAWLLHEDSQNYTPRSRKSPSRSEISGDTPSLAQADISEHEELVSRIWALVYELRAELIRKARLAHVEGTHEEMQEAADAPLWALARLLNYVHEYLEAYGERILHGDAEFHVESLIRLAGWTAEFTPERARTLRYAAAAAQGDARRFFTLLGPGGSVDD